jgi:hypothetical protein
MFSEFTLISRQDLPKNKQLRQTALYVQVRNADACPQLGGGLFQDRCDGSTRFWGSVQEVSWNLERRKQPLAKGRFLFLSRGSAGRLDLSELVNIHLVFMHGIRREYPDDVLKTRTMTSSNVVLNIQIAVPCVCLLNSYSRLT